MSAALALVSDLTLPPPKDMFTWEVAVVERPAPPETRAPSSPPVAPAPLEPQPVKTPAPPKKPQTVETEPVVQAQRPLQTKQPVETTQPMQEVQQVQEYRPVQETQPVQEAPLVPVQQVMQEQVTTVTLSVQQEARPSRDVTQSVSRSDVPVETTESIEQPLSTTPRAEIQPLVTTAGPMVQDQTVTPVPAATERSLVEESQAPVETAQKVEPPVTARNAPAIQQRAVQRMPVRSRPAARPDYGWLAQALWANVEQRKRYPMEAKLNRWEGKVILRLTIEQRGTSVHLLDLALEESSGHAALDRHTEDMVRKAFPIEVKHALAQPQIQLHLPFSYSME